MFTPESNLLEVLPPVAWQGNIPAKPKKEKTKEKEPAALPEQNAETVIGEYEETDEFTSDKWWIYALVLLGAGVIALLFYYQ